MSEELKLPMTVLDIMEYLPHRYPFLMLDRVVEFVDGEYIRTSKNVTFNEPYFVGHFPGRPVMPGVMMLEAMAQSGALYAKMCHDGPARNKLLVFSGCDQVRFRHIVTPGDMLDITMREGTRRRGHWKMTGEVTVNGKKVVSAVMKATEVD